MAASKLAQESDLETFNVKEGRAGGGMDGVWDHPDRRYPQLIWEHVLPQFGQADSLSEALKPH